MRFDMKNTTVSNDQSSMESAFDIVHPDEVVSKTFNTCDITVTRLTKSLGCEEMRVNQVLLEPGDVTTPHSHDGQEEVFVAMTGGHITIDGTVHAVPEGGTVRVHTETVRNLCNHTEDETHVWLAFGAPPVGSVEDFGAYVLPDNV